MTQTVGSRGRSHRWRADIARLLWHAHPARPGPEHASLRASQWWPLERIEDYQARQLRELVAAAGRVPHYGERFRVAGVGPRDIASFADLQRLPILERADLVRLGIRGLKIPGSWGMRASSSGSMGRAVEFLWPLGQMRWLDAGEARARGWLGWNVGERSLEVRCRPVRIQQAIGAALLNAEALHAPSVTRSGLAARLARSLAKRPPTFVWGVSNALYVVALALLDEGSTIPVKACWSGGNHLHPHYRRALAEAFRSPVYERYASMETGLIAHECPEGGSLHVPAEGIVAEIVAADGSPAAPGEAGDVLVTCLRNRATPLIRYRLGDRAIAPRDRRCVCGRGLPVFGTVAGRTQDFLRTSAGGRIGPRESVAAVYPRLDTIVDFQVIQDRDSRLEILVIQRDSERAEADRESMGRIFAALVGPPAPPRVVRVEAIALTPGGKLRTIVAPDDS